MPRALIVDDDTGFTAALSEYVARQGIEAEVVESLREARARCQDTPPDLILLDLILPDGSGLDLLEDVNLEQSRLIVITGHPSVDVAVESLRARVDDFLTKPLDFKRLNRHLADLGTPVEPAGATDQASASRPKRKAGKGPGIPLVGESNAMQAILDEIRKVAPTGATVLIEGDTGTGKELVAQTIHQLSKRRAQPFLAMNCGALPAELIGSELFGHERGSFTGAARQHTGYIERAAGGTLFLDEVTEMPLEQQAHLLRVLETGSFTRIGGERELKAEVRIVAATNRRPEQAVAKGDFRQDLYYRLMVFPIRLPPLRAREDDIERLARYFLDLLNGQEDAHVTFSKPALQALQEHTWPGNVRELRNAVQRAFILAEDGAIAPEHLTPYFDNAIVLAGDELSLRPGMALADAERRLIEATLNHYKGNKRASAEALGVSLKTLYNRLNQYRDEDGEPREQASNDG